MTNDNEVQFANDDITSTETVITPSKCNKPKEEMESEVEEVPTVEETSFCDNDETDMKDFDSNDFQVLSKALQNVATLALEYHDSEEKDEPQFRKRVKMEYSLYACSIKPNISNSKWKRWMFKIITKYMFLVLSILICVWLLYSIIRTIMGKQSTVPILYAIVYLVLFNPFYSFLTVTLDVINYNESRSTNKSSFRNVTEVEGKVKEYVESNGNTETFVAYFVGDKANLEETLSQKMENLDAVDKFFSNQLDFILKSRNPFIQINTNDILDKCLQFLLNKNSMLDDYLSSDIEGQIYFKSSAQIRLNAKKILEHAMGILFDSTSFTSYDDILVTSFNETINSLISDVILLVKINGSTFQQQNYYIKEELRNVEVETERITTVDANDIIRDIINNMKKILYKLKLLRYLGLDEERYMNNLLFDTKNLIMRSSKDDIVKRTEQNVEMLMSNVDYIKKVVGIVINNKTFVVNDNGLKRLDFNINDFYFLKDADYLTNDSLSIKRTKEFINKLRKESLEKEFLRKNKMEMTIIKRILLLEIRSLSFRPEQIIFYLRDKVIKDKIFEKGLDESLFVSNIAKVFKYVFEQLKKERKNAELYDDGKNDIENEHKYITFEEFDVKISNFDEMQFDMLLNNVKTIQGKITYFIDRLNDLNDKMERKQMMNKYYGEYLILYYIASFFIMLDTVWKYYFDTPFDISYMNRTQNAIVNRMAKKSENEEEI